MSEIQLPSQFDSFGDARKQGFIAVKNLKEQGKKVAGVFCTYAPLELILAAGAVPIGLCAFSDETIPEAEKVLPRNLCPLVKSSYGFAITDKCPYMYFSDLMIGETTCDGKKKMYELLEEIKNLHVMQLPQTQNDEASKELWYKEVLRLKERIEQDFGVTITDENIKKAIKIKNEERKVLKEFYELSKACPPPITGAEQLKVLYGSQFKFDQEAKIQEIRDIIDKIKADQANGVENVSGSAKRILITGCPLAGVTEKIVKAIEESGGVVVAYENCIGIKPIERLVDETIDPYRAIADRYLQIGCSVMTPNNNRLELLSRLVKEFKVDGVVEMTLQACHTYNLETTIIRKHLKKEDMPFISMETDYSTSDVAQLKTRLAAFIEMLS
ncbi:Benzoyl-CoA reductase/2-hydroxyglutaryl-CoA dehydratase subunit, BcrC/BadD/HgdB [Desulfitobacterium dichloroeliminans LMG P-21439]|uniref:Benzoyl-CoA reductase/2-hydroxyglutaryl-CoA dehydratase subunit, BcrC/BadD/HgdB n=1 Tax=Desulfitobacterium dichloroeliminans (strain LMG P-21439 / DCA1) TaxID=871963 RepID=L0FDG7_DESDL|nr:double-cubane-cluster-containing anaerobic reductase [Desulfitobacterium dichloroeliminans]AGA70701.1 Benzoyl-CoA reductase/2-hydroxyglutaryl-CoA dehydratase subunit, BcrC/BadD/HgdB [Desulfitobacterium dichloroeliminans LMG P-21439]